MKLSEIQGDLFSSNDNLVHCVSQDLKMGKGIATQFKKRFGKVNELIAQKKKVGEVAMIQTDPDINGKSNFIFYMITKEKYFEKPDYVNFYLSLVYLRNMCITNNIKSISMPKIGCGLDKLEWDIVKTYLQKVFSDTNISINVYYL